MTQHLTDAELLALLRKACAEARSQQAWAESKGISPAYVSRVLNGRDAISDKILTALGYKYVGGRYAKKD